VSFFTKRLSKQGDQIDVIVSAATFKTNGGKPAGMVVNLTDISEQKQLEAQLQQAQKMESVGRLAGGIAHDFNNMLGVILGQAQLAMKKDPDMRVHKNLERITEAATHSADLTRQLLAFARKQAVAPRVLNINETISGMLKMLRRLIGENIDLAWLPGENLMAVKIDPTQIDQMLANLCVNARGAISGVGRITIETGNVHIDDAYCSEHTGFVSGHYTMFSVSDDGCGMDKETLRKVFEPFFTTKAIGEGTGLGLAMVYGIVKQNGGFINAYSEPDQGSSFKIYLPVTQKAAEAAEKACREPVVPGSETILVVEDEASILELAEEVLTHFGYTVLVAETPQNALDIVSTYGGNIQLLLTDIVMPEMNGKDLKIRLEALMPDIKVLFMSGYTANIIMHQGILEKNVNFLQKPFSIESLAHKVREVLNSDE